MKKVSSIIIIILIVLIIGGIYLFKNKDDFNDNSVTQNEVTENIIENNVVTNNEVSNTVNNEIKNEVSNQVGNEVSNNTVTDKMFDLVADENFDFDEAKTYKVPIIVEFGASYCPPCREMEPILKRLNEKYKGKVIIKTVDVEKYPELTYGYDCSLIPTQIIIDKNGKPYYPKDNPYKLEFGYERNTNKLIYTCHVGYIPEKNLEKIIEDMVK